MTEFVGRHGVRPVVSEVFAFDRAREAFEHMERGSQFGKIVVKV